MKRIFKSLLTHESGFAMLLVVSFMALAVPMLTSALAFGGALSKDSLVKSNIARKQYSGAGGREYVSYLSSSPEKWDDWVNETGGTETLTINDDTVEISGTRNGTSSNGALDYCIFGEDSVEIKEDADVQCGISSNGNVVIKEDAVVTGNVRSGGNVTLGENATVIGDISAAGTVSLDENASVTGTVTEGIPWTPITGAIPNYDVTITITDKSGNESEQSLSTDGGALPLTFNLIAGGSDVTVEANESYGATPGSYGTLEVKEDATITFISGNYAFDQVTFKEDVTINLTKLSGPIVIDVVNDLEFKEDVTMTLIGGTAADIAFRVGNNVIFKEDSQTVGTYFTPLSPGGLLELKEDTTITGALLGANVKIKEDSTVIGMPSLNAYLSFFGP